MKQFLLFLVVAAHVAACAQSVDAVITVKEVSRIENVLASDAMQGRKAGTPGAQKAAHFIADEFKKAGLQPFSGNSYLQEFVMQTPQSMSSRGQMDGVPLNPEHIAAVTQQAYLKVTQDSGYEVRYIKAGDNIRSSVQDIMKAQKNMIVLVASEFANMFQRLKGLQRPWFKSPGEITNSPNVIFILGNDDPKTFTITVEQQIEEASFANVVGILPGKSLPTGQAGRKNEYVIFSAHYDHLGIGQSINSDSIYNGANDDAAGTTAVIMLANYFKQLNNNERTIVFAAFTAEEIGGFGSQYFSRQFNPDKVVAMFNIEMIGTESKWGKASAYITGYDKSNMGKILQKNLQGSSFTFYPDPYPQQQLFYRSDNATLARLGVPAHTISTAKMDAEPYYHSPEDEVQTLDMENMAQIIKAIALSSQTILSGADTPERVAPSSLN